MEANYKEVGQGDMYVLESIEEISEDKTGHFKFKVKWVGFGQDDCTWEPESAIPKFIQEYYKDEKNLKS